MQIDILTLFPAMFKGPFDKSILRRAQDKSLVKINIHNLRDWATDKRRMVDDRPYGGGKGMILKVDVIDRALHQLKSEYRSTKSLPCRQAGETNPKLKTQSSKRKLKNQKVVLLTPQGKTFDQSTARKLAKVDQLILICGHYEGFDERVRKLVDMEISIGHYVLTGGELPAMVMTDTIVRLLPGVLSPEAVLNESFSHPKTLKLSNSKTLFFDFPQYTRPPVYKGMKVPAILLSGDHKKINEWRRKKQVVGS